MADAASPAVFLDRDNTIIKDAVYSVDPNGFSPLPGAVGALKRLISAGYRIVVITNQSGVARGVFTEEALIEFHEYLRDWFAREGAPLDGVYYCPHYTEGTATGYVTECDCRKPAPGMLLRAAEELHLDLSRSWMVGDRPADVAAGKAAGCRTIRVLTGPAPVPEDPEPDFLADNLPAAADMILRQSDEH